MMKLSSLARSTGSWSVVSTTQRGTPILKGAKSAQVNSPLAKLLSICSPFAPSGPFRPAPPSDLLVDGHMDLDDVRHREEPAKPRLVEAALPGLFDNQAYVVAEGDFHELVTGWKPAEAGRASNRGDRGADTPFGVPAPQLPRFGGHSEGDAGFHYSDTGGTFGSDGAGAVRRWAVEPALGGPGAGADGHKLGTTARKTMRTTE